MESSTASHLSVAMTTKEADNMQTTDGSSMTSSSSSNFDVYAQYAVVFIGVVGTAGNALILYALVASKQHKKHLLIVNQNALDLFGSFFLIVTYAIRLCNIYLTGTLGQWLCIMILSEYLIWCGMIGSVVNLAAITVDRYLKVVHPVRNKKWLRPWVIYLAMAFSWLMGFAANTPFLFATAAVNGVCYSSVFYDSDVHRIVCYIWYIVSFYVVIIIIFSFCYGRILVTVRRQARVMASHDATGSSTTQTQSHQLQSSVIKTMILVCALYAITWLPANIFFLFIALDPNLTYIDSRFYASVFIAFIYTCANPFIYATKFDPVTQILSGMIPCKKNSVQPSDCPGTTCSGTRSGTNVTRM